LKPRHVVLPWWLIVRYSCGSKLKDSGDLNISLPLPGMTEARSILVKSVRAERLTRLCIPRTDAKVLAAERDPQRAVHDPPPQPWP
jgi:hypothetical protein